MTSGTDSRRRVQIGLAVRPDSVWAVPLGRNGAPAANVTPWMNAIDRVSAPTLRQVFETLQQELDCEAATLHVALLPPVVQARRLEFPRLKADEARRVLTRSAGKYFFGVREPQVVGATILRGAQRSPMSVFAVAAPARVVDALFEAAEHAGWRIETLLSAYDAWARAVRTRSPVARRSTHWIVHCDERGVEGIRLQRGRPALVRNAPMESSGVEAVARWISGGAAGEGDAAGPLTVIGEPSQRQAAIERLARHGVEVADPPGAAFDAPHVLAAGHVARASGAELLPDRVRTVRLRRVRQRTLALGAAAAAFVAIAAGVEYWGAQRELRAIAGEREALGARVDAVIADRDVLLGLNERLATLSTLTATAPRWSGVIAHIAEHLPRDAHLVGFRGLADSLVLDGVADRAAGVFEAMQRAPRVRAVRAQAPIRRELRDGRNPIERFTLSAQLGAGGGIVEDR